MYEKKLGKGQSKTSVDVLSISLAKQEDWLYRKIDFNYSDV